jgi:four helix bundle protein
MENVMLRIYETSLQLVRALRPVVAQIERHDPKLADQLRRSVGSVPLHIAEGSFARGKNRPAKYQVGCSEAREALACCHVAIANDYIAPLRPEVMALFREVTGTLVTNIRRG